MRTLHVSLTAVVLLLCPLAGTAGEASDLSMNEWTVPWPDTRPRDPALAPDGTVWFVGQAGHYVARFDPDSAGFRRIDLPDGTGPHNVIVDEDGTLWIAGNLKGWIGHLDPDNGELTKIDMPVKDARDPHTLVFNDQGQIWFTVQWGNFIGRLDKSSGHVDLVRVATPDARPYGIDLDSHGHPWVALLGTNALATVDPDTLKLREIPLPRADARPRRLVITADDVVWYGDYAQGYLGRYDSVSDTVQEWRMPGGDDSGPYAMAADAANRIWAFETRIRPNRLVGFDPQTGSFFASAPVPSGGGTVRNMVYDPDTNSLWFGTDTNNLGRAQLP